MNVNNVVSQLQEKYPGKTLFFNPDQENPTEILCEIESTSDHPEHSLAVAVIDQTAAHVHNELTEEYTVVKGTLTLTLDEQKIEMSEGDSVTIEPGQIHSAIGDETWITCTSRPGWRPDDHHLIRLR